MSIMSSSPMSLASIVLKARPLLAKGLSWTNLRSVRVARGTGFVSYFNKRGKETTCKCIPCLGIALASVVAAIAVRALTSSLSLSINIFAPRIIVASFFCSLSVNVSIPRVALASVAAAIAIKALTSSLSLSVNFSVHRVVVAYVSCISCP
ncbi:hypothetical protein Sjap_015070 [Stephania japonica]|uniref:Uncharacterized protein n=1 Tax=Stephania japonica TaxID=461633 RepID=A0AAP0NR16_9MAGN